ncbi:uncharacterized protein LOC123555280 [Mercenaria mercenaria]|uniref:uncharacterized protein LOC123555280 n=1 Tax=Mercenaria mercenaria TaxID=6596 RepID=UPI00234F8FA7|nr:uncharacterized protein LOC123555280 [Mercenaria mercenaria]
MADNKSYLLHFEDRVPCSSQQPLKYYTDFAGTYNQDCEKLGTSGPAKTASIVADNISENLRANVRVLDVGAGTGLVAVELRNRGFKHIDALDQSEAILSIAKASDLYENYIVDYITESPSATPSGINLLLNIPLNMNN